MTEAIAAATKANATIPKLTAVIDEN
jgi:hypothetical protein